LTKQYIEAKIKHESHAVGPTGFTTRQ
jgi:hypothetical protein